MGVVEREGFTQERFWIHLPYTPTGGGQHRIPRTKSEQRRVSARRHFPRKAEPREGKERTGHPIPSHGIRGGNSEGMLVGRGAVHSRTESIIRFIPCWTEFPLSNHETKGIDESSNLEESRTRARAVSAPLHCSLTRLTQQSGTHRSIATLRQGGPSWASHGNLQCEGV